MKMAVYRFRKMFEKRQFSAGMGGNFGPEQVATFNWNGWQFYSGICKRALAGQSDAIREAASHSCPSLPVVPETYLMAVGPNNEWSRSPDEVSRNYASFLNPGVSKIHLAWVVIFSSYNRFGCLYKRQFDNLSYRTVKSSEF